MDTISPHTSLKAMHSSWAGLRFGCFDATVGQIAWRLNEGRSARKGFTMIDNEEIELLKK